MKRLLALTLATTPLVLVLSALAAGAPTPFQLVFSGSHVQVSFPTPTGLGHVGTFTTNSPLCPAGHAEDIAQDATTATRLFTCDGSNGTFTARVGPHLAEHGGQGFWQIISGTGPLTNLRGKGSFQSVRLSGSDSNLASITFRGSWSGLVDLDAIPPTITLAKASVHKPAHPRGSYTLRLNLKLSDGNINPVSYTLLLLDPHNPGQPLARRSGRTTNGTATLTFQLHPARTTRLIRATIILADPVGNQATIAKTVPLK